MRQVDWRLLGQWLVMVVLAAALGLAVMALLGMGAVLAIGLAGADVLAGLPPLLLAAGVAAGLLWWLLFTGRQTYTHWDSHRDAERGRADLNLPPRRPPRRSRKSPDAGPNADNDPALR